MGGDSRKALPSHKQNMEVFYFIFLIVPGLFSFILPLILKLHIHQATSWGWPVQKIQAVSQPSAHKAAGKKQKKPKNHLWDGVDLMIKDSFCLIPPCSQHQGLFLITCPTYLPNLTTNSLGLTTPLPSWKLIQFDSPCAAQAEPRKTRQRITCLYPLWKLLRGPAFTVLHSSSLYLPAAAEKIREARKKKILKKDSRS